MVDCEIFVLICEHYALSIHFFPGPLSISLQQNCSHHISKEGLYFWAVPYFLVTHQFQIVNVSTHSG